MHAAPHLVIIGGAAAGANAAAMAGDLQPCPRITLVSRSPHPHPSLPPHITRLPSTEAIHLDASRRSIELLHLPTGRREILRYDTLLLATGCRPFSAHPLTCADPRVITIHRPSDLDGLLSTTPPSLPITVVGAGHTGLETIQRLHRRGHPLTLVERRTHVLPNLDPESAPLLVAELARHHIQLHLDDPASSLTPFPSHLNLRLNSGKELSTGLVLLATGREPENTLARQASLALGFRGHVQVSPFQQTTHPAIYAIGSVCEFLDPVLHQPTPTTQLSQTLLQATTAIRHIFLPHPSQPLPPSPGTTLIPVFGLSVGLTGATGSRLQAERSPHLSHHHTHVPTRTFLKVLYCPASGKLLGAQIIGPGHLLPTLRFLENILLDHGHLTRLTEPDPQVPTHHQRLLQQAARHALSPG